LGGYFTLGQFILGQAAAESRPNLLAGVRVSDCD
jgi:hypothetical protein